MKNTSIDISSCEECLFFWTAYTKKLGKIPHCNYYQTRILYTLDYSAKEKPPNCKVMNIVVNEED